MKILNKIRHVFLLSSLTVGTSMAADYKFNEYYQGFQQIKNLRASWYDQNFVNCATNSPSSLGWNNRKIRVTLTKSGIASGFGEKVIYTNDQYGYFLTSAIDMPLVVGQSYNLKVDYYGQHSSGNNCVGGNTVRSVATKDFIYDKHDTVLTFGVDINLHSRKLHHVQTNRCLYPNDLSSAFDTRIGAASCSSNPNQAFEIIDAGTGINGEVKIKSQLLKQCISPRRTAGADGAVVRAGSCLDNGRTVFAIDKVTDPNTGTVIPDQFRLRHKESNTCLYNHNNIAYLWTCWGDSNFIFTLDQF